jgi:hypothetical protein
VYAALISVSLLLGLGFVIPFGPPWRTEIPSMAWLQAGLAWVAVAVDAALFLSLFHVPVPAVVGLAILLTQDVVFGWRVAVLARERRAGRGWNMKPYAKAIVAAAVTGATAGLIAAQTAIPMSPAAHGWVAVALAVLGGVGGTTAAVYRVPNAPMEPAA